MHVENDFQRPETGGEDFERGFSGKAASSKASRLLCGRLEDNEYKTEDANIESYHRLRRS